MGPDGNAEILVGGTQSSSGTVILNLDGDEAGLKATERTCRDILLPFESTNDPRLGSYEVRIATFPPGVKDADEFVKVWNSNGNAFLLY